MLIIFGGLPGVGKTTVAKAVARALRTVYLRIDTIEDALQSSGVSKADVGATGYVVGYEVALENLLLGATVVADSVNPLAITRNSWIDVAERARCKAVEIEVICSEAEEHLRRFVERESGVEGRRRMKWDEVLSREYEAWARPHMVLDTSKLSADDAAQAVLRAVADAD